MGTPCDMIDKGGKVSWAWGEGAMVAQLEEGTVKAGAASIWEFGVKGRNSWPGGKSFGNFEKGLQHG
jgi:hypothetical protein